MQSNQSQEFVHIGPADKFGNGVGIYSRVIDRYIQEAALKHSGIVHIELGYTGHHELWQAYRLAKHNQKLVLTLHDPPIIVGKPYAEYLPGSLFPVKLVRKVLDLVIGRLIVRKVVRSAAAIIILNSLAKDTLIEHFSIEPSKIHSLPLPILLTAESNTQQSVGSMRILFFGNISSRKGVHLLVKAFAETFKYDAPVELRLAGNNRPDNTYIKALNTARSRLQNPGQVIFLGFLKDEELAKELTLADVVVLPYLDPGIIHASGPLVTAMGAGKPVIASRIPIFTSEIIDNETGLLFNEGSVEDLKSKLLMLWSDPALAKRLGHAAAKHIREEHSQSMIRKQLIKIYQSL